MRAFTLTLAFVGVTVSTADLKVRTTTDPADLKVRTTTDGVQAFRPAFQSQQADTAQDQNRPSFSDWLAEVRVEAISRGLREETVDQALATVDEPLSVVLERDRTQAETVLPLETYIARQLRAPTLQNARQMAVRHADLLSRIEERYEVPPQVIMSVWGIESNFGRFTGVRPIVAALATLAWDPRRSTLFRNELFSALEILDRGYIELANMRGSWAGAMGQPQFMPSSYLKYAEDFDGDSRRDIWKSHADIFASIANYLKGHGWVAGERWGREVKLTPEAAKKVAADVARRESGCRARREMTVALPLDDWQKMGVRQVSGAALPKSALQASLVSGTSRHFLVYRNYDVLLEYNCAHAYALSVALLSDRLPQLTKVMTLDERGIVATCAACGRKNRLVYEHLDRQVRCASCKAAIPLPAEPIEIVRSEDFDRIVAKAPLPVVVDYWAPWCGPCRMVAPELIKVAARNAGRLLVVKVNTDALADLGARFGIRSIPTLAVFAGGREVGRTAGARPAADIEAFVQNVAKTVHH